MVESNEGIFISYRRDGTTAYAGWLADSLGDHFGEQNVFRDIGSIEPGMDFVEAIERALESCAVMLVVIGRNWAALLRKHEETGQEDYTRLEIATALKRNVRVIPVLVQGAAIPRAEELPVDLAALRRRQAIELHDTNWKSDVVHLIGVLENIPRFSKERKGTLSVHFPKDQVPLSEKRPDPRPSWSEAKIIAEQLRWNNKFNIEILVDGEKFTELSAGMLIGNWEPSIEAGLHHIEAHSRSYRKQEQTASLTVEVYPGKALVLRCGFRQDGRLFITQE